jgi:hypothetical protein
MFCSFTLRIFAIARKDMPANGHSSKRYQRLKMGNLKSSKSDHISTRGGPF